MFNFYTQNVNKILSLKKIISLKHYNPMVRKFDTHQMQTDWEWKMNTIQKVI